MQRLLADAGGVLAFYPPSVRQVCEELLTSSTMTAHDFVDISKMPTLFLLNVADSAV